MRVVCVAAARPNFMKIKPVLSALEDVGADCTLLHTGQHYDAAMSDVFFDELGLRAPDVHLDVGPGSHAETIAKVMIGFEEFVKTSSPDIAVVVGDVNSTMACAITAAKEGVIVAHVESGLRSRDWSMPEEVNRVVVDRVSDLLLAPSADAGDNLRAEGYREDQIYVVGNVMIDTLLSNVDRARERGVAQRLGLASGQYGAVTLHRPANVDDPVTMQRLINVLDKIATDTELVLPLHPRTKAALQRNGLEFERVRVIEPLGYLDFIGLIADSAVTLTDSGGIQEETTVLGVPCLTLRDNTERPITITEGTNQLVGTDPSAILAGLDRALSGAVPQRRPELWDGHAGTRIADALAAVDPATLIRPTSLRSS